MPDMDAIPGLPVWTWCPAPDSNGTIKFRILKAQFGDGYQQRVGDGIHSVFQSWPMQFQGKERKIARMVAFLQDRAGHKSFHWTPPLGELGLYACDVVSLRQITLDVYALGVTFEQTFRA